MLDRRGIHAGPQKALGGPEVCSPNFAVRVDIAGFAFMAGTVRKFLWERDKPPVTRYAAGWPLERTNLVRRFLFSLTGGHTRDFRTQSMPFLQGGTSSLNHAPRSPAWFTNNE